MNEYSWRRSAIAIAQDSKERSSLNDKHKTATPTMNAFCMHSSINLHEAAALQR